MSESFKLLLAEDSDDDAELIELALQNGGLECAVERVCDEAGYVDALSRDPDVIISDYVMPQFDAPRALFLARQMRPTTPMIVISRAVGEELAVETMRQGAADYLLKDRMARLPDAVRRLLERRRLEAEVRETRQALSDSEEFCREVLKALPIVLAVVDRDGTVRGLNREPALNPAGAKLTLQTGAPLDQALKELLPVAGDLAHAQAGVREVLDGLRQQFAADYPIEQAGSRRWFALKVSALNTPPGNAVVALEEITQRKRYEEALLIREQAVESSNNAIVIIDALAGNYPLAYVNRAFLRLTGRSLANALGQPLAVVAEETTQPTVWLKIKQALERLHEVHGTLKITGPGGKPCWCRATLAPVRGEGGMVTHFVATLIDVSESRSYQQELERRTYFDALTGLPNRLLCKDRLEQAIELAQRQRASVALVRIDLDRLGGINSSFGYKAGDQVLQHFSRLFKRRMPQGDTVGRIGGDSFLLIVSGVQEFAALHDLLDAIRADIARPVTVDNREVLVTASVGAALFPRDGRDAESVERSADLAVFQVKSLGGNDVRFARPEHTGRFRKRLAVRTELHHALENRQFELRYQPILDPRSGRTVAAEAQVYWQHPRLGSVPLRALIAEAERSGLSHPIALWALATTCRQLGQWKSTLPPGFRVALDMTEASVISRDFPVQVRHSLDAAGAEAASLEIAIAAQTRGNHLPDLLNGLDALRDVGVQIGLDDFASTGLGLAQLSRLPVDRLKLDRSLISGLPDSHEDCSVVAGVVGIARTLGLATVADGVEREDQLRLTREIGFDEVQGPLLCDPLDGEDFLRRCLAGV